METKTTTIRIPADLMNKLKKEADANYRSLNQQISMILANWSKKK